MLQPDAGEPARIGFIVSPIELEAPVSVRTGDYGLDTRLTNVPQTVTVAGGVSLPVEVRGVSLTLNASAAHGPFVTLPRVPAGVLRIARAGRLRIVLRVTDVRGTTIRLSVPSRRSPR